MPSAEISMQDAALVLHKWMTESTKLQAVFACPSLDVHACVVGLLRPLPDSHNLAVIDGADSDPETANIRFNPLRPCVLRYGDDRVLKHHLPAFDFFKANYIAVLTFAYPDGTVVALFEAV